MGIFNQLKSLFIVEDNEGESSKSSSETISPTKDISEKKSPAVSGKDTERFVNILFKAIEDNNIKGYDYLEFVQSINNLKKQGISSEEDKLFNTAYALAKTMNVDKEKLLKTADFYLSVLNKEKVKFNDALVNNAKVKLKEKNSKLASLNKSLIEDKKAFEELKKRIASKEKEIAGITKELDESKSKVERVKAGFNNALKQIVNKIILDKDKINKYLK